MPLFTFNKDKYLKGENPFEELNPYENETIQKFNRRLIVKSSISDNIELNVELKAMRKLLNRILQDNPKLKKLPEDDVS